MNSFKNLHLRVSLFVDVAEGDSKTAVVNCGAFSSVSSAAIGSVRSSVMLTGTGSDGGAFDAVEPVLTFPGLLLACTCFIRPWRLALHS